MPFSTQCFTVCNRKDVLVSAALAVGIFLSGLVWGALALHNLNPLFQEDLSRYLAAFLQGVEADSGSRLADIKAWYEIVKTQTVVLGLLWFLGLTVLGTPLILLVIGGRGFILGFTVGFLVQERAGQGLLLALITVLPQNLFYVPAFLGGGILSVYYSLTLLRGLRGAAVSLRLGVYSLLFLFFMLFVLAGAWIEAYMAPVFLRLLLSLYR
ncbi:MAG: stage sporulation protein [Thermacetogenium sp.]|jgi:stage II sporulation protein M|nr:stage sporulation protein [Thermacetogenium sp.]